MFGGCGGLGRGGFRVTVGLLYGVLRGEYRIVVVIIFF